MMEGGFPHAPVLLTVPSSADTCALSHPLRPAEDPDESVFFPPWDGVR